MKIIQSLFVNQAALNTTELKSTNQEEQLQGQPKKIPIHLRKKKLYGGTL